MKIIKLSQTQDLEAWLDARRGVITGTKAKAVKPLSRGTDRTPAGFWELLGERLAIAKDGEPEIDRGHRLEAEAIEKIAQKYELDITNDCGMWVHDSNDSIAVSPDASEKGDKPSYAVEVKCLDTKNHIKALVKDMRAKKSENYNPLDSLKVTTACDYVNQALQYFVVNEHLQKLYFGFYDDRVAYEQLELHVVEIERWQVEELVVLQLTEQLDIIASIDELVKELTK